MQKSALVLLFNFLLFARNHIAFFFGISSSKPSPMGKTTQILEPDTLSFNEIAKLHGLH
jgi:hypothetical protein